jgi:SAM-dependent methyltransferase
MGNADYSLKVWPCQALFSSAKGLLMVDYDYLEDYRDLQTYDLLEEGYDEDYPLAEQWARSLGGPLLDLGCGTGTMAIRMAELGYEVMGVDIIPEMIAWASQKGKSIQSGIFMIIYGTMFQLRLVGRPVPHAYPVAGNHESS